MKLHGLSSSTIHRTLLFLSAPQIIILMCLSSTFVLCHVAFSIEVFQILTLINSRVYSRLFVDLYWTVQ